jgi:hypothetical protein
LFLPIEGFECLSLTDDGFGNDPGLSYTSEQLRHHEAAQALLTNPPLEGAERQIWSRWRQIELFHIDAIHLLGLVAQAQAGSSLPPAPLEHLAPPIIMDTGQSAQMPIPRGQPMTQTVTINDAMPFCVLFSRYAKVSLKGLHVFLTLQILILSLMPTSPV